VNGSPVRWEYRYDNAGRLAEVRRDGSGVERYLYDGQGRRAEDYLPLRGSGGRVFRYGPDNRLLQAGDARYEHDARGFRSRRVGEQGETRYHYAPDYRLLAVELPDGRTVEYGHDDQGLRNAKYVDGRLTERFRWHNRAHLATWAHADMAGGQWWEVAYAQDGRPVGLVAQGQGPSSEILLHLDQIGSVRMVEFPSEYMVKEILYDAFGNVVKDGNRYLRTPLGFAGGLHDLDTGLVRFGWRDYDPDTGRFTAKDPLGSAGGDSDWYGYCLDDPVNGRDPEGLNPLIGLAPYLDKIPAVIDVSTGFFQPGPPENGGQAIGAIANKVVTEWGPEYGKKAAEWYLKKVDENTHKIMKTRYGDKKE
jgi:RHS repeat-associated protein